MGHRSRAVQTELTGEDWHGKPAIAILNTWSDLSPCHHHLRDRAGWVKLGVLQAGGMPVELPVMDFAEQCLKPTLMLYRNMGAMEVEEVLRSHPVDGAVLMGGCDKSTPAPVMGAVSMGLPFVFYCPQARCCAATMRAKSWVRARIFESTGTTGVRVSSARKNASASATSTGGTARTTGKRPTKPSKRLYSHQTWCSARSRTLHPDRKRLMDSGEGL